MYILQETRQNILKSLKAAIGKEYSPTIAELEAPRNIEHGDIAFPCFELAKGLEKSPVDVAKDVAKKIKAPEAISKVEAVGSYVNFTLDTPKLAERLVKEISAKIPYGTSDTLKGKKIMVEYAQPNTHKEVHVGHLRNALFGQGVVNILKANGATVIPTSYINDLGLHVAKCLFGIQKFHPDEEPEKKDRNAFLGKVYAEASVWLDTHEKDKKQVQKIYQALEEGDKAWIALWKKTKKWSMEYIKGVFHELNLTIEEWYYESDLIAWTKNIIDELLEKGIAEKSEGAIIVNLEDQNLAVNLLVRSDGTLVYNAKDLALAYKKDSDHSPDVSLYVVDVRQSLAMKQLFATLKLHGFTKQLIHISHEFLTLPEGAISSRTGNIISYDQLRDEMLRVSEEETRTRHKDWSDKKVKDIARKIAFAAMKFSILKSDLDKIVVFDIKKALSFDGFTGPYCLYTIARIESIFRKAPKGASKGADMSLLKTSVEAELLRKIADFPDLVERIGQNYHIASIAQYVFNLAKNFSEFYHDSPVLTAKKEALVAARLELCRATLVTLKQALSLLHIESVDEM